MKTQEFQLESKDNMEEHVEKDFHQTPDETYYLDLVNKANELKSSNDWQYGSMEFEQIRAKWDEGPEIDNDRKKELYTAITEAMDAFHKAKKEHYERQQEKKRLNLERRDSYLQRLRSIVESKKWSAYNEVYSLQKKFEETRPLPPNAEAQNEDFQRLMDQFNEGKVEYLVKIRQKEEENLMIKLAILDKMNSTISGISEKTTDWDTLDRDIEDLSVQWRKVGRVVKEKSDEVWEKYKSSRDNYFALKLQFNEAYRGELDKNLKLKTQLCEKAEALLEEKDLAVASKEMNLLNKRWKEIGPVAREHSDTLWDRFKAANDKFSEIRNENLDTIRDIENQNLDLKEALCQKAEEIASTDQQEQQKEIIEKLFQEWNSIGPIPKRKTKKVWSRFKRAIDIIQEQRRNYFKKQRLQQKDNLRTKREIVQKIIELAASEQLEEALQEVKSLQSDFQKVGFVPIKQKNKIWDEYRAACDLFYKKIRESGTQSHHSHGSASGQSVGGDSRGEMRHKQQELFKLKKECEKLNDTILQYADAKTYIKPNKKGVVLMEEIQQKIDEAKKKLSEKSEALEKLRQEMESLGN